MLYNQFLARDVGFKKSTSRHAKAEPAVPLIGWRLTPSSTVSSSQSNQHTPESTVVRQ